MAGAAGISLRTGCFCNPGAGETAEGITEADVRAALELDANMNLGRFLELVTSRGGKSAGAMRVFIRRRQQLRRRTPIPAVCRKPARSDTASPLAA
jgi:hypothetical protein